MTINSQITPISPERIMLEKMQNMQNKIQADFSVSNNPADSNIANNIQGNQPISFSTTFSEVLNVVNTQQVEASKKITAVEMGKSDDLVGAMIESQKASLSFSALMQVRNKVVASFDEIMKMPV